MSKPGTLVDVWPEQPSDDLSASHPCDTGFLGLVERALTDYLNRRRAEAALVDEKFAVAVDELTAFVLGGGKRIRPTFAWWGWRGAGGDPAGDEAEGVLQAVASLELIQACALIHDDLIDSSDCRRGYPTVHIAFAKQHADQGWLGSPATFGLAAAVLIGDLALAWADDMFADAPLPASTLAAARPAWRAMRTEVLAGQYLDVRTQATGDTSVNAALRIDMLKTAPYTVQRPLHLGAALAGADDELIGTLLAFGGDVGVAFQLRDDLLGVFGDPLVTGKPAGDDLREGKRTLLVALGLERAAQQGRDDAVAIISAAVGNTELSEDDVDTVRQALEEVGAVDAVEHRIDQLTGTAMAALDRAHLAEPAPTELTELVVRATKRAY